MLKTVSGLAMLIRFGIAGAATLLLLQDLELGRRCANPETHPGNHCCLFLGSVASLARVGRRSNRTVLGGSSCAALKFGQGITPGSWLSERRTTDGGFLRDPILNLLLFFGIIDFGHAVLIANGVESWKEVRPSRLHSLQGLKSMSRLMNNVSKATKIAERWSFKLRCYKL